MECPSPTQPSNLPQDQLWGGVSLVGGASQKPREAHMGLEASLDDQGHPNYHKSHTKCLLLGPFLSFIFLKRLIYIF